MDSPISLITCGFLTIIASCYGDPRMYSEFVSPFNFGKGAPLLRDVYPFTASRDDTPASEEVKTDPDSVFAPSINMNVGIISTNRLKLNSNRLGIKRVGFTCGIPGSGEVDPFELGPRFAMPSRRRAKRPRQGLGSKNVSVFAEELDLEARKLGGRSLGIGLTRLKRTSIQTRASHVARPSEFCWQAKIRVDFGNGTFRLCAGTIVGSKTVLTAAHCLMDRDRKKPFHPSMFTVTVGDENSERDEEMRCVETFLVDFVLPNPSYDLSLEDNDIGLVILGSNINFAQKPCACKLCMKDKEPDVGQSCVVAGDGRTREINGGSLAPMKWEKQRVLRQTFDSRCAFIATSGKFTSLDNFICAADPVDDASCQGDDGSAFVCFDQQSDSHYAAGIVSFSGGCGKDIGSQYTKVRPYLSWIEDNSPELNVKVQRGWNREIARSLDGPQSRDL